MKRRGALMALVGALGAAGCGSGGGAADYGRPRLPTTSPSSVTRKAPAPVVARPGETLAAAVRRPVRLLAAPAAR
ncbi:MAG: hypothetical protein JWM71_2616, partial [Solirubrobacteraceae bacterium]|nr:hypothetical protein [Solirubrobacteraceae bacterium]